MAKGAEETLNASDVVVRSLDDGKVSFSGPRSIREMFDILGTRYNPSTLRLSSAAGGAIRSALRNGTVRFNFGVSTLINVYDYQWGEHKDKGIASQEFGVSSVVDTVFAVGIGLLAAGAVAIVLAVAGVGVVVSTPALMAIAAVTALLAIGIGLFVDIKLDWPDQVKDAVNRRLDEILGETE